MYFLQHGSLQKLSHHLLTTQSVMAYSSFILKEKLLFLEVIQSNAPLCCPYFLVYMGGIRLGFMVDNFQDKAAHFVEPKERMRKKPVEYI